MKERENAIVMFEKKKDKKKRESDWTEDKEDVRENYKMTTQIIRSEGNGKRADTWRVNICVPMLNWGGFSKARSYRAIKS